MLVFSCCRVFSQASSTLSLPAKSSEGRQPSQEQLEPSLERPSGQRGGHHTVRTGVGSVSGRVGADLLRQGQAVQVQPSVCTRVTRTVQTESLQWGWMEVTEMSFTMYTGLPTSFDQKSQENPRNRRAKNPNSLYLYMLIRQILSSKIPTLGQNPSFWQLWCAVLKARCSGGSQLFAWVGVPKQPLGGFP